MGRVKLADLNIDIRRPIVRGLIIQTQNVQVFPENSNENTSWTFTLRDSPHDTLNVKFWGDRINIERLQKRFHVGDVVDIRSPKIYIRRPGHATDRFAPTITSRYFLWCKVGIGKISACTAEESEEFAELIHIPCNDVRSCMYLDIITSVGSLLDGSYINMLLVVLEVSRIQSLYRETMAKPRYKKTLTVTDQSLNEYKIILWDDENIFRSSKWIPRKTILFVTEARVNWSSMNNYNEIYFVKKTIVTEDPSIPETQILRNFFNIPDDDAYSLDYLTLNQADATDDVTDDVTDKPDGLVVMSIEEILQNTVVKPSPDTFTRPKPFMAKIQCFILDKNLDKQRDIIIFKCEQCTEIASEYGCYDCNCTTGNPPRPSTINPHFRCDIELADQTGRLQCRITGQSAIDILGLTPAKYMISTTVEQNHLKRYFTENQFEAEVVVTPVVVAPPHIRVMSLIRL